jgi:hypothetical protein
MDSAMEGMGCMDIDKREVYVSSSEKFLINFISRIVCLSTRLLYYAFARLLPFYTKNSASCLEPPQEWPEFARV